MTGFWIAAAALVAATLVLVLSPLFRGRRPAPGRSDYDLAVYRDQLAEVERDLERGVLTADQADAARVEIKRRMLAAAGEVGDAPPEPPRSRVASAAAIAVVVPALAIGIYLELGSPDAPDRPLAERAHAAEASADGPVEGPTMEQAIERLARRLESEPGDLEGWVLLGRSYLSMGRAADAAGAFGRAYELSGRDAALASLYGEALVGAAGGQVTPEAREAFAAALAADASDPRARYYLALARAQAGDVEAALQGWIDLAALSPPDAPWMASVRQQIARAAADAGIDPTTIGPSAGVRAMAPPAPAAPTAPAAPGPTREDMEAAAEMSADEQAEMIRGMVQRLADRLEDEPDDLDGWLRLARAYEVLGEAEKAKEAHARAEALRNR